MRTRRAALALTCLTALGLPASAAHASLAAACTVDGTLTFAPPLSLQPSYGTWGFIGTVTCVQATAGAGGASWTTFAFVTQPGGQYAGSCTEATFTDNYGLSLAVAGTVVTTTWTNPFVGEQAGVLVPIQGDCLSGLGAARMVTAGGLTTP